MRRSPLIASVLFVSDWSQIDYIQPDPVFTIVDNDGDVWVHTSESGGRWTIITAISSAELRAIKASVPTGVYELVERRLEGRGILPS